MSRPSFARCLIFLFLLHLAGRSAGAQAPPSERGFILSIVTADGIGLSDLAPRDLEVRVSAAPGR